MKSLLRKSLAVALLVTLSRQSLAAELPPGILDEASKNPADMYCYEQSEIDKIAEFAKECELNKRNLETMTQQFNTCLDKTYCENTITSSRLIFWSSVLGALVVGFVAASSR